MNFRWKLADEDGPGQQAFFADDEIVERHVGKGEYRGLEFLHVNAKSIINKVPGASHLPFGYTINAYRGCSHACVYCLGGDTPVLMADGRTKPIAEIQVGDEIYGTARVGAYRRYVPTTVVAHWSTIKRAYMIRLHDGTELIASGDHRFLTNRGWKHVTGAMCGAEQRPYLTLNNRLIGTGAFAAPPEHTHDYKAGYLSGMVRGDATMGSRPYVRPNGRPWTQHQLRLALADLEPLYRTQRFLDDLSVATSEFVFATATETRAAVQAIRTQSRNNVNAIRELTRWPSQPSVAWMKGFLAGIFDAEGSYSCGILRIANCDGVILDAVRDCLDWLGFDHVTHSSTKRAVQYIRVVGGTAAALRFFLTVDPVTTRKRSIDGRALKFTADLGVSSIDDLGIELPMFDITTGTGDFIANGVVSHNCFARPTHDYLGLNIGTDFDSRIVVKINAVERLRAELRAKKWKGDSIAMGTNTDPYQRAEGKYHLTRGVIGVLSEFRNPFSILTKSTLILRDLDLLVEAGGRTDVTTAFSIGTLDEEVWKLTEPGTPHPRQRIAAVRKLVDAGIPCSVLVAPILPGLSDRPEQVTEVVEACVDAGASSVMTIPLHLRKGVKDHYLDWLGANRPDLLPMYDELYAGRGYLPKGLQQQITAPAHDVLARRRPRNRRRAEPADQRPPRHAEPEDAAEQLTL